MLSAVIIARDEADRIATAVRSVAFADEVVVLDSGSSDDTAAIARAGGARVVETDWPGHVAQKNRALAEARGDWVLSVDADEEVTPALRAAIEAAVANPGGRVGFRVARRNVWLGRPLSHGGWFPDRRVRLVARSAARWEGVDPHDHLVVDGAIGDLGGELVHVPYRSLREHLATVDRYTARSAEGLRAQGRRAGWGDLLLRPPWHLFRALVLQQGLRDGVAGVVVASIGALYVLLKWARVRDPGFAGAGRSASAVTTRDDPRALRNDS